MTKPVKFLANFVYQVDVLRSRHRTPERFDVMAPIEVEIPSLTKSDLAAGAVVVRIPDKKGRLDLLSFDGWNGALWSALDTVTDEGKPARARITLMDYKVGFRVNWLYDSRLHSHTDPLRRAYARHLAPLAYRGITPQHPGENTKTVAEADLVGTIVWSNRTDALRRHLDAAHDLLVVDETMYVRRLDPVWAVSRDSNGSRARLTIPRFWINSDSEVMPQSHDGHFLSDMDVFRADRTEFALRGGIAAAGEIVSLDTRFLSRDDDAWSLFCRLGTILNNMEPLFRILPPVAVTAMKTVADAFEASSMWNVGAISDMKDDILIKLQVLSDALAAGGCPPRLTVKRGYALRGISDLLKQCRLSAVADVELHPDDEAGVHSLAAGA